RMSQSTRDVHRDRAWPAPELLTSRPFHRPRAAMRLPSASPLSSLALMLVLPLLLAAPPRAGAPTPLDIEQAMADPDWIGPPVESAWWAWDGRRVQYTLKRAGGDVRDVFEQPVDGGAARQVEDGARAGLDAPGAIYDATRSRMLFLRN